MPTITIHPPKRHEKTNSANGLPQGVPQLFNTPSGLALLEIQGTINSTLALPDMVDTDGTPSADGIPPATPVGKLLFPLYDPGQPADDTAWHKRVHLYVGRHQRLTGEVKKLARPVAVIRRRRRLAEEGLDSDAADAPEGELEIAEIVRFKLLFAHRPEPVGGASGG